jgi:uncharacterized protein (DUF885 family)
MAVQTNPEFDRWVDDFTADWVRHHPALATTRQYFEGPEQDALDRQLTLAFSLVSPYGVRAAQAEVVLARRGLAELRAFSLTDLSDVQRTSAAVIEQRLNDAIAGASFAQHRFIFNQIFGLHVMLVNFLTTIHPIRNERDAENYLARLALVPGCLDEGIAEAREATAARIVPPRFILERTIEQLDTLTSGDFAQHVLVAIFKRRLGELTRISAERRAEFVAAALICVCDRIVPAFGRVRAMLVEQLAHTDDRAGAWRLPNGAGFYANELATLTGSSLSAHEIHALGLREVARIEAEMDDVLRRIGYADGPLQARIDQVNETLRWPAEPDPREAILARLEDIVADAVLRSAAVFELRPKAPVTVKREPAFSEGSAAAHYSTPAPDGSQPGIYWIPLADVGPNVPWLGISMKSVA